MKPLRVLLVEDEACISELFAEVLAGMGHEVCGIEATEASAIAATSRCKPDMIIVDVRLGAGSGEQAMADILRSGFVPHVFVSGDAAKVETLQLSGIALQKPFYVTDLIRAMRRALGETASA